MKRRVIGFAGAAGSGKSTAAEFLEKGCGFRRVRFAGPLKAMIQALGLTPDEIDGHLKESPCELLGGKTPRWAMQSLGTEWGRELIGPDVWVNAWHRAVDNLPAHVHVVCDDVRFANEADAIRSRGGLVVLIERQGLQRGGHASEQVDFHTDCTLPNGNFEEFLEDVLAMGEEFLK